MNYVEGNLGNNLVAICWMFVNNSQHESFLERMSICDFLITKKKIKQFFFYWLQINQGLKGILKILTLKYIYLFRGKQSHLLGYLK